MNKKKTILFFSIVILFTTGCTNEKTGSNKSSEHSMSELEVSTTIEESDKRQRIDISILNGDWSSSTNQISIVLKNEEQQQIEVESQYMVGGEMFLADYDQQNDIYTFENQEESISFQILNESAAIIWYGTTKEETTGVSAPIEYTKKIIIAHLNKTSNCKYVRQLEKLHASVE